MNPGLLDTGWLRAKLALVALLIVYHAFAWRLMREFAAGRNTRSPRWYRWFNEVPSLLLIGIVLLASPGPSDSGVRVPARGAPRRSRHHGG